MLISRYAPTPSGYLHIGNIYNFLITNAYTRKFDGKIWLRIDDGDQKRVRDDYIEDIFAVLKWLQIPYDIGPKSKKDLEEKFSQKLLFEKIKKDLLNSPFQLFSCQCSRKEIISNSITGTYPATCYKHSKIFFSPNYNIRIKSHLMTNHQFEYQQKNYSLSDENHDFILWKKEQAPSYQILSLYHDQLIGTNCIIRGIDLLESTAIQMMLSKKLNFNFHLSHIYHHNLLTKIDGSKISKSTNKASKKSLIDQYHSPLHFFEDLSERIKIKVRNTKEFLEKQPTLEKSDLKVSIH